MHVTQRQRNEAGAVAVIFALLAVVLFIISALVIDLGNAFTRKRDVQYQADFAALAGGSELKTEKSGIPPSAVVDAVRDYLNDNQPQDDKGITPVVSSQLIDTDLENGEVRFVAGGLQVVTPWAQVDYGFAGIIGPGHESVDVQGRATVGVFSPGVGVMPVYAVSGCDYGNQTITDPAGGHVTAPAVPVLASDTDTNDTTLQSLSTHEVALEASGVSITLSGMGFNEATKVGFFRGDTLAAPEEQATFSDPLPADMPYTKSGAGSMTFIIPDVVTAVETAWYVRVFEAGTVNKWSARVEAQPLRVGEAVLECTGTSSKGNFGTLRVPRIGGSTGNDIPINIADGLQDPLTLNIHALANVSGTCTDGVDTAVLSGDPNPGLRPGTNCVATDPGLTAQAATEGLITGPTGYDGLLEASESSTSEGGGCAPDGTTLPRTVSAPPASYEINNDVLTCFLTDGATSLSVITQPGYSGGAKLSADIYESPRFFWQPVLGAKPVSGTSLTYSIVDFRAAFITDEIVSSSTVRETRTATTDNGLVIESGQVKQIKVVFINVDALSADDTGQVITPYLGVGPRILRLID